MFTEISVWHMKVISVSCTFIGISEFVLNVSMLSTTNDNNEIKNLLAMEEY
jgi:hypothetical protein